ncbi:MAG: GTPase [Propionibacteriaceae bacterium]|nr:GTPase [Propionibacteriaceae bacterium]
MTASMSASTSERCLTLLQTWRSQLQLNRREETVLAGAVRNLDQQLSRLAERRLRVAVFGRVGVGKSSLVNALIGQELLATDVAHGCTRRQQALPWEIMIPGLNAIELVDTPGIDEIAAAARARLAARVAMQSDLVLLVLDADISRIELDALETLIKSGKPVLPVLNRSDCCPPQQLPSLLQSISRRIRERSYSSHRARLPNPIAVSAAPRQAYQCPDGRVRSKQQPAVVNQLRTAMIALLQKQGQALLAMNALRQAEQLQHQLETGRLERRRQEAQGLIGRYAALKATGVAANPLALLDLAGGLACDTALVVQLCQLYDLPMGGPAARRLMQRLSGHNAMIGGVQFGLQLALSAIRQLLLIAAPFSGGISLAPAAPVALAQAALAVHTTRRTGRLTARWLVDQRGRGLRSTPAPTTLRRRLIRHDASLQRLLAEWPQPPGLGWREGLLP